MGRTHIFICLLLFLNGIQRTEANGCTEPRSLTLISSKNKEVEFPCSGSIIKWTTPTNVKEDDYKITDGTIQIPNFTAEKSGQFVCSRYRTPGHFRGNDTHNVIYLDYPKLLYEVHVEETLKGVTGSDADACKKVLELKTIERGVCGKEKECFVKVSSECELPSALAHTVYIKVDEPKRDKNDKCGSSCQRYLKTSYKKAYIKFRKMLEVIFDKYSTLF